MYFLFIIIAHQDRAPEQSPWRNAFPNGAAASNPRQRGRAKAVRWSKDLLGAMVVYGAASANNVLSHRTIRPHDPTNAMTLGRHLLADYWQCRELTMAEWEEAIAEAVAATGLTLLELHCRPFHPAGLTAAAILSESHLAVHTWPEEGYVAIDLFTCGVGEPTRAALDVLETWLRPQQKVVTEVERGQRRRELLGHGSAPRKP